MGAARDRADSGPLIHAAITRTTEPVPAETTLTAPALRRALIAGARRVIAGRDRLNRINVFPVADGDTGTNLAQTLAGLLDGALRERNGHVGRLLQRVGDDAIDGARGNSGAILAQFLQGVAEAARHADVLDGPTLATAIRQGAASARGALAQPVEGTILSVIDAFAHAMETQRGPGDRSLGFDGALDHARRALADTPRQMALLERAGVVDAGAQGFVDLLEGIAEFIEGGPRALRIHGAPVAANDGGVHIHAEDAHEAFNPARRWCTECLVLGEGLDRDRLRTALQGLDADSLVVAGSASRVRVHGHVAAPQALYDACASFGRVEGMKADDMLRQQRSAATRQPVAVVVDTAADLPADIADALVVHEVPVRVVVDGRDYLDKVGLTTADFYRRMHDGAAAGAPLPTTSQPPPGDFRRMFECLRSHHADVVYVGLSRAVSGTLQSAEHAAARVEGGRVHVFDTLNAAGGQALLAWRAAELSASGAHASVVVAELERLRPLTLTWAMARDIRHAVRGGRIPAWAAPLVRWTRLTPVARFKPDGRLGVCGGLFARERAPEAFAHYVAGRLPAGTRWRVIVGHCDAAGEGERLLSALRSSLAIDAGHLVETGPAIGAHAGQGALLVSVQPAPGAAAGDVTPPRGSA